MTIAGIIFRARKNALICVFLLIFNFAPGKISNDQAADWLAVYNDSHDNDFFWLHFNLGHTASEKWRA